jgi:23S rRNA pseudouridine2605 synthase
MYYLLRSPDGERIQRKAVLTMEAKPERLQKILAAAGLASRRKAEQLISAGLVSVNGHVITEPGSKADPRLDEIRVDGKLLRGPERHVYLAVYKPKGHMTTVSDPEGRPTIMDLLKGVEERVFPVGRLDYMSEGLLLLTNDGELMEQLTRAGSHVAKTYMVKVSGKPTEEEIDKLRNGIMLPPEPGLTGVRGKKQPGTERRSFAILTQPAAIQLAVDQENPWFEVTLTEGRNRQIRRMFEQIGYHIEKIKRVRYGSLTLDIEPGEFRHLTPKEVTQLRKSLDTPFKPKPIKVKKRDDRPERRPRVDAARFVKGRRGKPSADAPAPPPIPRRAIVTPSTSAPRHEFVAREEGGERSSFNRPRGPEFGPAPRRDDGFAAKRPYTRKPAGDFGSKPAGDYEDRPKRTYTPAGRSDRKPGSFDRKPGDRKPGSFARKPAGDFAKRPYTKRAPARPEAGVSDASEKRDTSSTGGFGFSKYNKPRFVKPSKHRDLGSDKTDNSSQPSADTFSKDRPYSKPRGATSDRGFAKRPGTGDPKYSKGPGKPSGYVPRSGGSSDFKRPGGDFKPRSGGSSDFKRPGGDFNRTSEGRPSGRPGGSGKSFGGARTSPGGGARGKSSGGAGVGAKRPGFGPPRGGRGGATGRPSAPPRRRPDGN